MECYGVETIVKFCSQKVLISRWLCTDISRGRGLVQLSCLWVWPEMMSKVNMMGGAARNNSKQSLQASSLVIKLI